MKRIATKKAKKGQKQVTLVIYETDNLVIYDDNLNNYHKVVRQQDLGKAERLFYDWVIQMHKIQIKIIIDPA